MLFNFCNGDSHAYVGISNNNIRASLALPLERNSI